MTGFGARVRLASVCGPPAARAMQTAAKSWISPANLTANGRPIGAERRRVDKNGAFFPRKKKLEKE
jgi:hypothetical protein